MTGVVKPKLTNLKGKIKIQTYSYNGKEQPINLNETDYERLKECDRYSSSETFVNPQLQDMEMASRANKVSHPNSIISRFSDFFDDVGDFGEKVVSKVKDWFSKEKDITADDIYVGEESGDELLPVSEELLPSLKQTIEEIFDMIISNQNQE